MNTWNIKGVCEHCGFAYTGSISSESDVFPVVHCSQCKKPTENFDEESVVDELNKYESFTPDYKTSTLG